MYIIFVERMFRFYFHTNEMFVLSLMQRAFYSVYFISITLYAGSSEKATGTMLINGKDPTFILIFETVTC